MEISVKTKKHIEAIDITKEIEKATEQLWDNEKKMGNNKKSGVCLIFCPHTTCGILINEPDAVSDIIEAIDEIEPKLDYQHKGNAQAHIKASLISPSLLVTINQGKLELGQWQKIFLAEFDGPRTRQIKVSIL